MSKQLEYVAATIAIAFGSQWAIRFFQNYRSKGQIKKDDIENLNSIISQMRTEIDRLEAKIDKMQKDFDFKEQAYSLAYTCPNTANCPVLKKMRER